MKVAQLAGVVVIEREAGEFGSGARTKGDDTQIGTIRQAWAMTGKADG